ncbi:hypothetical protein FV227_13990 [Methylobacterium sp. WL119]|uniref:hypothetical protein n=1 Tax=unclassified Methylobacterium TaxID=2615210 RepID=UPI0011CCD9E5|nr:MULTISPECIES: hypothetical protein [unclassified Methylobacterium]TXN40663.1 hypothetical protein FV225_05305 [Methylobacterium sp. WL93]TXN49987.1 hypothetical protein FV227_13990 [Methylobacterium sp. WL119]
MPNRSYKDTAVQLALERSYARIDQARSSVDASRSTMSTSRERINSSRAILDKISARYFDDIVSVSEFYTLSAMDDECISEIVDDFIAAYLESRDTGDETGADVIQNALKIIGRYLAKELGPKDAGVVMN